jgi:hypothetical protein
MVNIQEFNIDQDVSTFFETHKTKEIQDLYDLEIQNLHDLYICFQRKNGQLLYGWDLETIKLAIGFFGDGTYSYYAALADGQELFGDDIDCHQELPLEILKAIAD